MTKVTRALLTVCLGGFLAVGCGGSSNSSGSSSLAKKLMMCNMQSSSSGVTCTGSDQYSSCVESKCATQYKKCFGDGYQSGQTGGVCGTYLDCVGKAADPCKSGCTPSSECQSCESTDIAGCVVSAGCTLPTCTVMTGTSGSGTGTGGRSGGSGGSTTGGAGAAAAGTCKDVTACCAKISDANTKMACQQVASSGSDQVCAAALPSLKMLCP
jgi:hypothetical protein